MEAEYHSLIGPADTPAPYSAGPLPTSHHQAVLEGLLSTVDKVGLVMDAHLAALAIEHGLVLCSSDGDLARFAGLQWQNPLAPPGRAAT